MPSLPGGLSAVARVTFDAGAFSSIKAPKLLVDVDGTASYVSGFKKDSEDTVKEVGSVLRSLGFFKFTCSAEFDLFYDFDNTMLHDIDAVRNATEKAAVMFESGNIIDMRKDGVPESPLERFAVSTGSAPDGKKGKKKRTDDSSLDISVRLLTPSVEEQDPLPEGPSLSSDSRSTNDVATISFSLHAACYCGMKSTCTNFVKRLTDNMRSQLSLCVGALGSGCTKTAAIHQFTFNDIGHIHSPLLVAFVSKESRDEMGDVSWEEEMDEKNVAMRKRLHECFGLPLDRPRFLTSCRDGRRTPDGDSPLRNVHVGARMKAHGLGEGATVRLVRGDYEYYHYLMEGFNDKGWGCAYRSLMTLTSWFRLNHYISPTMIPSHRYIQETLTKVDDKPASFVGSKTWIGSQEVGYCLDAFGGITSRFIFVSQGGQVPNHARDLMEHFEQQGTPVMIGGGQLAFTLLGVAFDESSGKSKYLILDPHYVGPDDMGAIQSKQVLLEGYRAIPCTWRSADMFSDRYYYNFCLPYVPKDMV